MDGVSWCSLFRARSVGMILFLFGDCGPHEATLCIPSQSPANLDDVLPCSSLIYIINVLEESREEFQSRLWASCKSVTSICSTSFNFLPMSKHVQTCQILSKHVQTNINCFHSTVWYDMVCNYEQNCSRQYITICNTAIAPTDWPTGIDPCQPSHLFEAQGFHGCSHVLPSEAIAEAAVHIAVQLICKLLVALGGNVMTCLKFGHLSQISSRKDVANYDEKCGACSWLWFFLHDFGGHN